MAENFENKNINSEEEFNENDFLVDLFDDEGNKQTFEHLDTVQVNGNDYVICIPYKTDEEIEDGEVDEVVILKMETDENDEYILIPEEDSKILDKAYELFRERNEDLFDWED